MRLDELAIGARGRVAKMDVEGKLGRRLAEMGLTRGAVVTLVRRAPLRDPIEYVVRGAHLLLRATDAAHIAVEEV